MEDIRWVKGPNGPVACEPGASGTCYECGGRMVFRRGCKRKRGNTEWTVRDHFMHVGEHCCTGESWQHKAAKHVVATQVHRFRFLAPCKHCKRKVWHNVTGDATEELHWQSYFLDVGFCREGTPVGAVEILHTHEVDEPKVHAMTAGGLTWVEVHASDVLEAAQGTSAIWPVTCVRGSRAAHPRCALAAHAASVAASAAAAAAACAKKAALAAKKARPPPGLACALNGGRPPLAPGVLDFGECKGMHVNDVPENYLEFLCAWEADLDSRDRVFMRDLTFEWHFRHRRKFVHLARARVSRDNMCVKCMEVIPNRPPWKKLCTSCYRSLTSCRMTCMRCGFADATTGMLCLSCHVQCPWQS